MKAKPDWKFILPFFAALSVILYAAASLWMQESKKNSVIGIPFSDSWGFGGRFTV